MTAGATASHRRGETNSVRTRIEAARNPSAPAPNAGTITVEPDRPLTQADTRRMPSTATPIRCQIGPSRPKGYAKTPTTAAGMTTTDTSGRVRALPDQPIRVQVLEMEGAERGRGERRHDGRCHEPDHRSHAPNGCSVEQTARLAPVRAAARPLRHGDQARDRRIGHLQAG